MKSIAQIAAAMYEAYCTQAGGLTFDGLPYARQSNIGDTGVAVYF